MIAVAITSFVLGSIMGMIMMCLMVASKEQNEEDN